MNNTAVTFRYGTPVTSSSPTLIPGSFVFDSVELCLWLDTDGGRVRVLDPLKLALTGGTLTGDVEIVDNEGTTLSSFSAHDGTIEGQFLVTKGNIAMNTAPNLYAVIDSTGKIRTRTKAEMIFDLHILDPDTLGDLAYVDSASGSYTPVGTVSAPTVTVNYDTESVVKSVDAGDLPTYTVSGEVLTLSQGTQLTTTPATVMKSVTSVDVSQPTFTGTQATITVS